MARTEDPTSALREAAGALQGVVEAMSCNQASYKVGKKAFLYVGPGRKGVGWKAMFKLGASRAEAEDLAEAEPERFELGTGAWVTARFSDEEPLPRRIWSRWLAESYASVAGEGGGAAKGARRKKA